MTSRGGRFRRADRLRSSRDFRRVGREGLRRSSAHFVVLLAPKHPSAQPSEARLGVTASRRVGGAITRNRVKRRIREWFRRRRVDIPPNRDVVVIARPGAGELSSSDFGAELDALC